jgi:hypothetical protein
MPLLDFTEIPEAHVSSGKQDSFELFAAELLTILGYEIIDPPGRGADLGKDLIVAERRKGIGKETVVRWLVSCKHKAHSGRTVGLEDESNLLERVEGHQCQGFMGFYSTLPSASLVERLKQLATKFEYQIRDSAIIERELLGSPHGLDLARRYFPISAQRWQSENPTPAQVLGDSPTLLCQYCGRDLLNPPQGVYAVWRAYDPEEPQRQYVDLHWACKGACDRTMSADIRAKHDERLIDAWEDVADLCMPVMYLKRLMGYMNSLQKGDQWSDAAFDSLKTVLIAAYPHIARNATSHEQDRIHDLLRIPSFLGGLGSAE